MFTPRLARDHATRHGLASRVPTGFGRFTVVAFLSILSGLPGTTFAKGPPAAPVSPDESQLQSHGHYRNRSGTEVHSPSASRSGGVPAGASAHCRDGTY
ncbi:MAG: DUF3761 domain-containing protein, partial [Janthinobacterium lividum]